MMAVKGYLHNGEHTLIPVTVKMIHSTVRPLHMVKLVSAVRNFCMHDKHVRIDLEDGTEQKCDDPIWMNERRFLQEIIDEKPIHQKPNPKTISQH